MPDYKELYYQLFRATEEAINGLVKAQRECEELYMSATEENVVEFKRDNDQ